MNANSFLTVIFGWVPSFVSSVWNWFSGEKDGGLFGWMANHWKGFVLTVCILAVIVDLVIYLFRWRPYRVWISFFRRMKHPARPSDPEVYWDRRIPEPQPWPQPAPEPAVPVQPEDEPQPYAPGYEAIPPETMTYTPVVPQEPATEPANVPLVYRDLPDQAGWEEDSQVDYEAYLPEDAWADENRPRTRRSRGKRQPGKRLVGGLLQTMTGDPEEPPHIRYQAPRTAVNQEDAYKAPYIPPQWQEPGSAGTGMPRRRRSQP